MIRGYPRRRPGQALPFVNAEIDVPAARTRLTRVDFLIDTGADFTILAPYGVVRLGLDWARLTPGLTGIGVGGTAETSATPATLGFAGFSIDLQLRFLLTPPGTRPSPIPSLLGRDILSRFCVVIDQATDRVLVLTPDERDALRLP